MRLHVQVLGLGVYDLLFSLESKPDSQQRRVYHLLQLLNAT